MVMGGARANLYNFIEEYSGGKFIALYKHIKKKEWYIVGELERPIISLTQRRRTIRMVVTPPLPSSVVL